MKLKKILWTLPVITLTPIVVLASCGVGNSKQKQEATKEMSQLTSGLFEKNKSEQLASISNTDELNSRTSEIEDAISQLNEKKTLLSESDFNSNKSNLDFALSAIQRRKEEIQAEQARLEAQRIAQEQARLEAQRALEANNQEQSPTTNKSTEKTTLRKSFTNAAKAALGKTAQVAKAAAKAAIATAKQNTPINPDNISVKNTIKEIANDAKEATKETAKAAGKAAGKELVKSGAKGILSNLKEKIKHKKHN